MSFLQVFSGKPPFFDLKSDPAVIGAHARGLQAYSEGLEKYCRPIYRCLAQSHLKRPNIGDATREVGLESPK